MSMKKFLAGILACCVVCGVLPSVEKISDNSVITASAADDEDYTEGTYEQITYKKYGDYIEISDCDPLATSVVIQSEIDGLPVTSIGESAFQDCYSLTEVIIPDSVTSIGVCAFMWCESLTEIIIPDSVTSIGFGAFSECTGLTKFIIPNSVTSIGGYAFYCCTGLTEITIPDSVTSIGGGAFSGCTGMKEIKVSENNKNYEDINGILFNKDKTVLHTYPSGKNGIEYTIPGSVTSIGDCAFSHCQGLTEITIPDSTTSIGVCAFYCCQGLTEITIPNSVTSIGGGAFQDCKGLTEITIPNSVINIGYAAFSICTELKRITIPGSVTSIAAFVFQDCIELTEVTIPDSVTSIEFSAFSGCESLTEITIPDSVTSIEGQAFRSCTGLTEITIPESVTSIGDYAFEECSKLTSITILNTNCEIYDSDETISNGYHYDYYFNGYHFDYYFNGTIYGYENSTAQAYAEKYNRNFVSLGAAPEKETGNVDGVTLIGDANCNGTVDIADATLILQALGNPDKYKLSAQGKANADCYNTGDGISGSDAAAIQKYDAKVITKLPEMPDKK